MGKHGKEPFIEKVATAIEKTAARIVAGYTTSGPVGGKMGGFVEKATNQIWLEVKHLVQDDAKRAELKNAAFEYIRNVVSKIIEQNEDKR